MVDKIRILVVDDHAVVRSGISAWIESEPDLEVIGEASDGIEAVDKATHLKPDVILMDLVMPKKSGLEAIREILEKDPNSNILVITSFSEKDRAIEAVKSGALGFITKDASPEQMHQAIREISLGNPWLSPDLIRSLIHANRLEDKSPPPSWGLTDREMDVLQLIAQGYSDRDIAEDLTISRATVRYHVTNVLTKLNVENRTRAAFFAIKEGLISLSN